MHAIGAVCVIRQVPVAPLYWVERADGEEKRVFESDRIECSHIIDAGHYDTMYVVAREYRYTDEEFAGIARALEKLRTVEIPSRWSPHQVWYQSFLEKPKNSSLTYFERAIHRYEELLAAIKAERAGKKRR